MHDQALTPELVRELYGELRPGTFRWTVLETLATQQAAWNAAQLAAALWRELATDADAELAARALDALVADELAERCAGAAGAIGLHAITDAGRRRLAAGDQLGLGRPAPRRRPRRAAARSRCGVRCTSARRSRTGRP